MKIPEYLIIEEGKRKSKFQEELFIQLPEYNAPSKGEDKGQIPSVEIMQIL